jgi:FAD/FMN-containing dehydrogenase
MGADNLLEAVVVTPRGEIAIANGCQHSDLFWALRGGGSGTFGVIVKATMKAYPTPQTTIASLIFSQAQGEVANLTSRWWEMAANIHEQFPKSKMAVDKATTLWRHPQQLQDSPCQFSPIIMISRMRMWMNSGNPSRSARPAA